MNRTILVVAALAVLVSVLIQGSALTLPAFFLYFGTGIFGCYVTAKKGYLTRVSVILFLLAGWWFLAILVGLGPITLLIATFLPEKRRCPLCKELIREAAARCPHCRGEIDPLHKEASSLNSPSIAGVGILIIILSVVLTGGFILKAITSSFSSKQKTENGVVKQGANQVLPTPTFISKPTQAVVNEPIMVPYHEGWKTLEVQTYNGQKFTVQYPPEYTATQEKDINCPAQDGPCTYSVLSVTDDKGQHVVILGMKYVGTPYGEIPAQQGEVQTDSYPVLVAGKAYTLNADKAKEGITSAFAPTQFHPGYAFTGDPVFMLQSESREEIYLTRFMRILETIQFK
jgi:hypothetical protein